MREKEQESREAVLADVRAHCKLLKDAGFDGAAYDIRVLVERLDAAWKRELESVTKRNGLGNTKKWRDALEAWVEYWMWGGYDGLREHRLKAQTKAALAAPPRNCDRFATAEEAIAAHKQAETNCPPADCPECPYIHGRKSGVDCLTAWIFAPAAQEGGGTHESK